MSFLKNLLNLGQHGSGTGSHQQRSRRHGGSHHSGGRWQNERENTSQVQNPCTSCNFGNSASARFCQQCGNAMQPDNCSSCGAKKVAGAKFCANCGVPQ